MQFKHLFLTVAVSLFLSCSKSSESTQPSQQKSSSSSILEESSATINSSSSNPQSSEATSSSSTSSSSSKKNTAKSSSSSEAEDPRQCDFLASEGQLQCPEGNYSTVEIGDQTWMAENLRYENGRYSSQGYGFSAAGLTPEATGYFYTWFAATNLRESPADSTTIIQGVCPNDWHIPTVYDWRKLLAWVDEHNGDNKVGSSLSAKEQYWVDFYLDFSLDEFGFNAAGSGYENEDGFQRWGEITYWWTSTEDVAYFLNGAQDIKEEYYRASQWDSRFNVRCLRD